MSRRHPQPAVAALAVATAVLSAARVAAHGNMVFPRPRASHNQVLDDRNKCGCQDSPGGCYSNASSPGFYCGLGCIGEACLYYQIGCFQSCPVCSYTGKTLYPVPEDLKKAGNCPTPPAPTLGGGDASKEHELRTYNIDNDSKLGDWTRWNPWRSPGTAGKGNPAFQPCGVNSGSDPSFPDPPAAGQPQFANGTDLPPLPKSSQTIWRAGSTVEASWAIYANHGGGYSYRICKKVAGQAETEACYQRTPLKFASNTTKIVYADNSRPPHTIPATTTDVGTYPPGSQWRKNPIPMCNCDIGVGCGQKEAERAGTVAPIASESPAATSSADFLSTLSGGKTCKAVPKSQCGHTTGTNTCLACGADSSYDCEVCCPGLQKIEKGGYSWCQASQPGPSKPCSKENPSACFGIPYSKSYLSPGQSTPRCPTGLMFPSLWDDGYGQGHEGEFMFSMVDELLVPANVEPGEYSLSWRWDCEQTPQVWNSCADVTIVA